MDNSTQLDFVNPATLTPLFIAQWSACAYPVSDFWAESPRYLYYVLLFLTVFVRWYGWLANVFLGVCATYAGVAAIEAFIIASAYKGAANFQTVDIPYINPNATDASTLGLLHGNSTFEFIPNLVTDYVSVFVAPWVYENDTDAIFAILVTGFLVMLPMHSWSTVVNLNRARQILMGIWNILMLAGCVSVLVIWPKLLAAPYSFRFCYPGYLDGNSTTADGPFDESLWKGDWNKTVWETFSNVSTAFGMSSACMNPCFRSSQVLRRPSTMISTIQTEGSVRTSVQTTPSDDKVWTIIALIFLFIYITIAVALLVLIFSVTPLRRLTRVPVDRPKELLTTARKEIFRCLASDIKSGFRAVTKPATTIRELDRKTIGRFFRFWLDLLMLAALIFGSILTPILIVCFIAWIEWWIHKDIVSDESPRQVGQWSTSVSLGLILISAGILELKYVLATTAEVDAEIVETREKLEKLKRLRTRKAQRDEVKSRKQRLKGNLAEAGQNSSFVYRGAVTGMESDDPEPGVLELHQRHHDGSRYAKVEMRETEDEIIVGKPPTPVFGTRDHLHAR